MRIILCLNKDLMSNIALNLLRPHLLKHDVQIFLSENVGNSAKAIDEIKIFEQYIPCNVVFPLLEKLGKPKEGNYYTFNQVQKYDGFKIHYPKNINSADSIKLIKNISPDLIISIRFGQIFKNDVINIPTYGIMNLHSGILPDYKGILATLQAIIHNEKEVGCTLHYINDATIDTGPIIGINKIKIDKKKSLFWHINKIYDGGIEILTNTIMQIEKGQTPVSKKQDLSKGKYFSLPTKSDQIKMAKLDINIIDKKTYAKILKKYNNIISNM